MSSQDFSEMQFIATLKEHLQQQNVANVEDILSDYREHFVHGKLNGKTEAQISADLGNPVTIAKAYEAENLIREVQSTKHTLQWTVFLKVLGRLLVLAPFNFFMLLIPGFFLSLFFIAGWAVTLGFVVGAVACLGLVLKISIFSVSFWAGISAIAGSIGLLGLGVIAGLIVFMISRFVLLGLVNYLQWNLKFILEK
jgi:uncharacterized membrane protein